jgi:hypothetical protein
LDRDELPGFPEVRFVQDIEVTEEEVGMTAAPADAGPEGNLAPGPER